jgi:hypothetical protein
MSSDESREKERALRHWLEESKQRLEEHSRFMREFDRFLAAEAIVSHYHRKLFGREWDGFSTEWIKDYLVAECGYEVGLVCGASLRDLAMMLRPPVVCTQAALASFLDRSPNTTRLVEKLMADGILAKFVPPAKQGGKYKLWFADPQMHEKASEKLSGSTAKRRAPKRKP